MPDIECRVAKLEERLEERRRQTDDIMQILLEIQKEVSDMKGFSSGVKWTIITIASLIGSVIGVVVNRLVDGFQ